VLRRVWGAWERVLPVVVWAVSLLAWSCAPARQL
jgi:hypothetical protein